MPQLAEVIYFKKPRKQAVAQERPAEEPPFWLVSKEELGLPTASPLRARVAAEQGRGVRWTLFRAQRCDVRDGELVETVVVGGWGWQSRGKSEVRGCFDIGQALLLLESGGVVDLTGHYVQPGAARR